VTEMNDHIDSLHRQCLTAREIIRRMVRQAKWEAAQWTPRPVPQKSR